MNLDNLFYRKMPKAPNLKDLLRSMVRNKRLMLGLIILLPLIAFLLFGNHGVVQRIRLLNQKAAIEEKIKSAEAEGRALQQESKALDGDPKMIEKVAREKYGMHREGEKVYKEAEKSK